MTHKISKDDEHIRPSGISDVTVEAAGKVSEGLETIEQARGHLYALHQLIGHADLMFDDAVDLLQRAGHAEQAAQLENDIIGRNVIHGRWTFQIVEDFDDNYYAAIKAFEKQLRDTLLEGRRHIYESEMKENRRTHGKRDHQARP